MAATGTATIKSLSQCARDLGWSFSVHGWPPCA
jgi:hypothetical protein